MRIAQVCYLFSPAVGGVETHVLNIGAKLVEWGHEVDVLTSDFLALNGLRKIPVRRERIRGMDVYRFRSRAVAKTRAYAQRIRFPGVIARLARGGYDVIHCHSLASLHFDLAWIVSRLLRIPLVVTGHYSPDDLDRLWTKRRHAWGLTYPTARLLWWRTWMTFALRRTDLVVCIAQSERERMIRYLGLDPDRVVVIPNGVNPSEFDAVDEGRVGAFREARAAAGVPIVLYVGRISRLKGPDILVEAALSLLASGVRARFILAGHREDEGYAKELDERIRLAGASDSITLEELDRSSVVEAFKASDIVVLPSRGEVFGITLAEGMYCGKVVVGSNSGGIPEVIDDGVTGFLFDSGDAADLARVLENALGRLAHLDSMRQAAKMKAVGSFTWEKSAEKLLEGYKNLRRRG